MKNKAFASFGLFFPRVIHNKTVTMDELKKDIMANCSAKSSDVVLVMTELKEQIICRLKEGDIVAIDGLGRFKLEAVGEGVKDPRDFDLRRHMKKFVCRFNPSSEKGVKTMFEGIRMRRLRK